MSTTNRNYDHPARAIRGPEVEYALAAWLAEQDAPSAPVSDPPSSMTPAEPNGPASPESRSSQ